MVLRIVIVRGMIGSNVPTSLCNFFSALPRAAIVLELGDYFGFIYSITFCFRHVTCNVEGLVCATND